MSNNCSSLRLNVNSSHIQSSLIHQSSQQVSFLKKTARAVLKIILLCGLLLTVAACGPETTEVNQDTLAEDTKRIASDYALNGNLDQASTQLQQLDVANANQWLLYVTEQAISEHSDLGAMKSLALLANALDLHSPAIDRYIEQNNFFGGTAQESETIRIAKEYVLSGDLTQAEAQLERLGVANAGQWLLRVTERAIELQSDLGAMQALSLLTLSLDLHTPTIDQYIADNNLLGDSQNSSQPEEQPAQSEAAVETASSSEPNAVAAVEEAPQPSESATDESITDEGATENSTDSNNTSEAQDDNAVVEEATATPVPETATPTPEPEPTATPIQQTVATALNAINVRGGPGTNYGVVGAMQTATTAEIVGKNPQADWWQVRLPTGQDGWVYAPLVETTGDVGAISVAENIPEAPPTATPAPIVEAPVEPPPDVPTEAPVEEAPAEAAQNTAPPSDQPHFRVLDVRLWSVEENGGWLDGNSVHCGEKRELHVEVLDANGSLLNNVAVQVAYGAKEIYVTGSQGKGDGRVEFVLGGGQDVKVIRDSDNREATSDNATGLSTRPDAISFDQFIQARYCTDEASCQNHVRGGCFGHYSWTVKFQRNY